MTPDPAAIRRQSAPAHVRRAARPGYPVPGAPEWCRRVAAIVAWAELPAYERFRPQQRFETILLVKGWK